MAALFAGTSGYAYSSWNPDFYPAKCSSKNFLSFYSRRLNSVEINYTFRQVPSLKTLESWIEATPPEFRFVIKANQRITHFAKLKGVAQPTLDFLKSLAPLQVVKRLGPILFQLPPHFKSDLETLAEFLTVLPKDMHYAFEFRHDSWFGDSVYELLRRHNAAICVAESETLQVPDVVTADFAYYRLRKSDYSQDERRDIALRLKKVMKEVEDVFVFFKHEETPAGALYAEELLRELRAS
ncbi:MAG TPA: DUF72 domain-containing protein [Pyrinomonadaceae bacterium]|nr:DUF72 domain-containing protein [Pyrinomonadaceae bacterium]